uniref:hypothetical protein n=1 Tax=Gelidibacter sp. TaxID=2018083 RepID=UPI00404AE2AE
MNRNRIIKNIKDKEDLEFLDSILIYVSKDAFIPKSFDEIVRNCKYPKRYFKTFSLIDEIFEDDKRYEKFIYEKALDKLIRDNLIQESSGKYSLDYEGMILIVNKGLLEQKFKIERKEYFQWSIWGLTLLAFCINLFFQIYNTFCKD